jgi:hypothetical protein
MSYNGDDTAKLLQPIADLRLTGYLAGVFFPVPYTIVDRCSGLALHPDVSKAAPIQNHAANFESVDTCAFIKK